MSGAQVTTLDQLTLNADELASVLPDLDARVRLCCHVAHIGAQVVIPTNQPLSLNVLDPTVSDFGGSGYNLHVVNIAFRAAESNIKRKSLALTNEVDSTIVPI